ncbi:5-methyltetrahydropteroyltriglutamate--homocysteine methyltransferase [Capillimicrobium parvum]|uniref:5-methyltetrahydropteroyltriglutamate--homocysteine methyltransferase n=1 Tax=Capillimicrobium parvum TaxID=2884022 RepID=A0A9E6XZF7_9ACTN|nr:5-methyltetrahydropteroyltriglutamate--homocysteine methyltransferase [Capillimicrobium parvum]
MAAVSASRTVPRAETVGSLLRPPALRAMFPQVYAGHKTPSPRLLDAAGLERLAELERRADTAVADVVRRQIDIGLDVITDGEMRRASFTHSLVDALGGFEDSDVEFAFTNEQGEEMVPPSGPLVGAQRVSKVANPALDEARFVRTLTDHPLKVTFPAPSYWYCEPVDLAKGAYSSQREFVEEVVAIQRELLAEVVAAGVRHVQMDWPAYVMAIDPKWRDHLPGTEGLALGELMDELIAVDNAVIADLPADVTTALHVCRGNYRSMWMTEGSLEPIAEQLFGDLRYDRLLVEWDDTAREGDFDTLRHVPAGGPIVVMGVVSSKSTTVESADDVQRRLEEAARYVPVEQLAISPQCGFASTWEGNELAEESQWRKLEVVVEVADRVWGRG